MEFVYKGETIENILNLLNSMQLIGITNAELMTRIVQQLNDNRPLEKEELSEKAGDLV